MSVPEAVFLWLLATVGFALGVHLLFRQHPALWTGSSALPGRLARLPLEVVWIALPLYLFLRPFSYARSGSVSVLIGFILFALWFVQYLGVQLRHTPPEELRRLRRRTGWVPVAWAVLLAGVQYYVWSAGISRDARRMLSVAAFRQEPISPLWQQTERLATRLREQSAPDLRAVGAHLDTLFSDLASMNELFAAARGDGGGVWYRWFILDDLINSLSRHAVAAAKQGDWERCRQATMLAVGTMRRILTLSSPEAQREAVHHVAVQAQILLLQLHRVAALSPRHEQALVDALQEGERVRVCLADRCAEWQKNRCASAARESQALARWGVAIEKGLRRIERENMVSNTQATTE